MFDWPKVDVARIDSDQLDLIYLQTLVCCVETVIVILPQLLAEVLPTHYMCKQRIGQPLRHHNNDLSPGEAVHVVCTGKGYRYPITVPDAATFAKMRDLVGV